MTCDEVREAFSDFYDGRLIGARLTEIVQHLDACSGCRAEWAVFSTTVQVVRRVGMAQPSPGFAARVRQRIEAPSWWRRLVHSLFVPLRVKAPIHAVALAVVLFAGLMLVQRSPELRREVDVKVVPPASVTRQAPPPGSLAPAPPVLEKPAPAEEAAGSSVELPAKEKELQPPALQLKRSAPTPTQSEEAARNPAPAKSLAPSVAGRLSSIPSGSADEIFSAAVTASSQHEYERAIDGFKAFIASQPRDARVADARFLLGEAYFTRQRYAEAVSEFEILIREYPDSPRVPTALSRQGEARLALGDRTGCQLLHDVLTRYPQTREAASARETLTARCP